MRSESEQPTKKRARTMAMSTDAAREAMRFDKQGFCGPVTALHWVQGAELLLTGRGTDVLVARVAGSQQRHLGVMRLFSNGRVHGIKGRVTAGKDACGSGKQRVLIAAHSQKDITIAELVVPGPAAAGAPQDQALPPSSRVLAKLWELDDWVVDVQFLRCPGQALTACEREADAALAASGDSAAEQWGWLAAGLAHNTVEIWWWPQQARVRCVHCVERPVLFTMSLHGNDGNSLVVAVGGFTRQVLCWQV
jgi:hypothetical protein